MDDLNLIECIAVFSDAYPPAASKEGASTFSTIQIYDKLQEHYPGPYSPEDIFGLLKERGYRYWMEGEDFVWGVQDNL